MDKLIAKTLDSLTSKNIVATPKNYAREFYRLAKEYKHNFEDINNIEQIINLLSDEELSQLDSGEVVTATDLLNIISKRIFGNQKSLTLVNSLTEILKPSINELIYSKIEEVVFELMKDPSKLNEEGTINKLLNISNERVELDREVLKNKSIDMKKIITLLVDEFNKSIDISSDSNSEVVRIKNALNRLQISKDSNREMQLLYTKFSTLVYEFEAALVNNKSEFVKVKSSCENLESDLKRLEKELEKLKIEKDVDFLTGVYNRRGYTSAVLIMEKKYTDFKSKYAIVFIDLDDFKLVNDNYGHESGDKVLKTFSVVIKKSLREADIVARYAGEEFIALISYEDVKEVNNFISRVKDIVLKHKFILSEEIKIDVRFSGGIALRENYNSYEDTIKFADILLYKAKQEGKNRVISDNGDII